MVSSMALGALVGASLLAMAAAQSTSGSIVLIPTPTAKVPLKAMTTIGCFSTGVPLEPHGPWDFQTDGNCQGVCVGLEKGVMGLVNGTDCWCGDKLPPKDAEIDLEECNTPCPGFPQLNCGGGGTFLIINSGFNPNRLVNFDPSSSSSKSSSSSSTTSVEPVSTVVVSTTPSATPKKSNSPNKAGIAAGVVVGVLALTAIIGGVYFFLRQRRRRQVEEEYRRQAAVNSFVSGNKLHTSNSSMTDSRLDPEFMMRRQSNGSIADNEDYSRRILKVTNPDGH